jgi:hypothetical protein
MRQRKNARAVSVSGKCETALGGFSGTRAPHLLRGEAGAPQMYS